jgi:hypothetical protein
MQYDGLRFRAECKLAGKVYGQRFGVDVAFGDPTLLATAQPIDAKRLRAALEQTFTFRKTHALPTKVPAPFAAWTTPYTAMAREDQLAWRTLDEVTKAAQTFLDPVLAGELDATWEPETWSWRFH